MTIRKALVSALTATVLATSAGAQIVTVDGKEFDCANPANKQLEACLKLLESGGTGGAAFTGVNGALMAGGGLILLGAAAGGSSSGTTTTTTTGTN